MSAEIVSSQLGMCHYVVKRNVGDVTHEESLRTFGPGDHCLNWVLGHLVATRCSFLEGLGAEPVWTTGERKPYDRHAPPLRDPRGATPLEEIWRAYELSQERLTAVLKELTPERLAATLPPEHAQGSIKTVGDLVAVLGMHDAYHAGQSGILRRLLGRPPADL